MIFFIFSDLAKSGLFPRDSITFEDDEDIDAKHLSQKNVPPVKKKMLWKQKKKSYQQKSIVFNENEDDIKFKDEELNVPKERLFKSQLKVKIKKFLDAGIQDVSTSISIVHDEKDGLYEEISKI